MTDHKDLYRRYIGALIIKDGRHWTARWTRSSPSLSVFVVRPSAPRRWIVRAPTAWRYQFGRAACRAFITGCVGLGVLGVWRVGYRLLGDAQAPRLPDR